MSGWTRGRELLSEGATPLGLGVAAGLGAFLGAIPLFGVQTLAAVALATVLGLNRVVAVAALNVIATPILPFLTLASLQVGSLTLGDGAWVEPPACLSETQDLMGLWLVGSLPVGMTFAGLVGGLVWVVARCCSGPQPVRSEP